MARDEVEALYGVPLGEFVAERNALAARLRKAGDRERAEAVKALRKPSVPAWAINQAVRADVGAAKALTAAAERLRGAHAAALEGGAADDLRAAMREEAEAVEAMTRVAAEASEGEPLGPAMLDRVRDTLHSVAGDEELRAEFEAGRVVRDRQPVGIGSALTPGPAPRRRARTASKPTAARRRKADQRVAKARKALADAVAETKAAADDLRRVRRDLESAERRAVRAEAKQAKAEMALEAAEAKLPPG